MLTGVGGTMQRCKLIVLSNAKPGCEDEYNDWYTDVHLADMLQVPGIVGAQSFRRILNQHDPGPYRWAYMALFECENDNVKQVVERLRGRSGTESVPIRGAVHEVLYVGYFEPIADLMGGTEPVRASEARGSRRLKIKIDGENEADGAALSKPARDSAPILLEQGPMDVDSMRIEDWAGRVAGPTYLEKNLQIARSTLHRWQRCNEVVALRMGRRRHVFPLAQFVDGRPVSGIRDVLGLAAHPRLAWFWLVRPSPALDGRVPIELLRLDLVEEVTLAARFSLSQLHRPSE